MLDIENKLLITITINIRESLVRSGKQVVLVSDWSSFATVTRTVCYVLHDRYVYIHIKNVIETLYKPLYK